MAHIYPLDLLSKPTDNLREYSGILHRGIQLMRSIPPEDRILVAQGLLRLGAAIEKEAAIVHRELKSVANRTDP